MSHPAQTPKYLKDYQAPAHLIPKTELLFDIHPEHTQIQATLHIVPQDNAGDLILHGDAQLLAVQINGETQPENTYTLQSDTLTLHHTPAAPFTLTLTTRVEPQHNKSFDGLYASGGNLYTQCEPEGFRRITYHPDRPDVMSVHHRNPRRPNRLSRAAVQRQSY